jgi:hypothetical protein
LINYNNLIYNPSMPNPKEGSSQRAMPTPEQIEFHKFKNSLGRAIEQRLNIPMAHLVHPQDLAAIGASVYAEDQVSIRLQDPQSRAREVADVYSSADYNYNGTTREAFIEGYPSLIGNGDYAKGEIATALYNASKYLNPTETKILERKFAELYAKMLIAEPQLKQHVPHPGVTIDSHNKILKLGNKEVIHLDPAPTNVVEYRPGLAGIHKIPDEVTQTTRYIYFESSPYINQVLTCLAHKYDLLKDNRFIGREDGIEEAGKVMLQSGLSGQVDIIIASMVHSAGDKELTAGIKQGEALLRPGGLFVIQAPLEVKPGEMSGEDMFNVARNTFQEPIKEHRFEYFNKRDNNNRNAYYAVFKKAA